METTKAQKKKVGRPAGTPKLLTPETQQAICAALEIAVPINSAVIAAGVSEQLYRQWMDKGEAGTEPYAASLLFRNTRPRESRRGPTATSD